MALLQLSNDRKTAIKKLYEAYKDDPAALARLRNKTQAFYGMRLSEIVIDKKADKVEETSQETPSFLGSSFLGGMGADIKERAGNLADFSVRQFSPRTDKYGIPESPITTGIRGVGNVAANTIGQMGFGVANDLIGRAIIALGDRLVPDKTKAFLKDSLRGLMSTDAGKRGLRELKILGRYSDEWAKNNPGHALQINSLANILGLTGMKKVGQWGLNRLEREADDLIRHALPEPGAPSRRIDIDQRSDRRGWLEKETDIGAISNRIDDAVKVGFEKGVKPPVKGKRSYNFIENYYDSARGAVRSVINRLDTVPTTVEEFSQALAKIKPEIWSGVRKLSQRASKEGIMVDFSNAAKNIRKAINKYKGGPGDSEVTRLERILKEWKDINPNLQFTPEKAEQLLSQYNFASTPFWNDRNLSAATEAVSNAGISNDIREALFKAIPDGDEYKALRKEYGNILAVEKNVADRAIVLSRQNQKGFFDLVSGWGTAEFMGGIASQNLLAIAKGFTAKLVAKRNKYLNNPNTHIKKMFKDVEPLMVRAGEAKPRNQFINRDVSKWGGIGENEMPLERLPSPQRLLPERTPSGTAMITPDPNAPSPLIRRGSQPIQATRPTPANVQRVTRTPSNVKPPITVGNRAGLNADEVTALANINTFRRSKGLRPLKKVTEADYKAFQKQRALDEINAYRKKKGLKPFKMSDIFKQ